MRRLIISFVAAAAAAFGAAAMATPAAADDVECAASLNILSNAMAEARSLEAMQMRDILVDRYRGFFTPLMAAKGTREAATAEVEARGTAMIQAGGGEKVRATAMSCIGNPSMYAASEIRTALGALPVPPYDKAVSCTAAIQRDLQTPGVGNGGSGAILYTDMRNAGTWWAQQALSLGASLGRQQPQVAADVQSGVDMTMIQSRDQWRTTALACMSMAPNAPAIEATALRRTETAGR
jgi:hypothetical protein